MHLNILKSWASLALPAVLFASACTDSELHGAEPPNDASRDTQDATSVTDATVVSDSTVTDATTPDASDAGCASNESCRAVLGELGPCQAPLCDLQTGQCRAIDTCVACQVDGDCQASAPACNSARCEPGTHTCTYAPIATCCTSPASCNDGDPCTSQTCGDDGVCGFPDVGGGGCCTLTPVLQTSFSPAPAFQFRSTVTDAGWSTLETSFTPSPPAALYCGNPQTRTIGSAEGAYVASALFGIGQIEPNASVEVKFRVMLDLRADPTVDRVRAYVREPEGRIYPLWIRNLEPTGVWLPVKATVPLPVAGPWTLTFEYNGQAMPDGPDAHRLGVLIDDIQVRMGCNPGCEPGTTCPSDDPCQAGTCGADGQCHFEPVPGCQQCRPETCIDDDPCTLDVCDATGQCAHQPILNCGCGNCDDQNACTIDRCDPQSNSCEHAPDPSCCTQDQDCRDGDPCTANRCDNGHCVATPIGGPGCDQTCSSTGECDDQDACTTDICRADGQCAHERIPNCGACNCDDGDACTIDSCNGGGNCVHQRDPACCKQDNDCHDGNACTANSCDNGKCVFTPLPLPGCDVPCNGAAECDDNQPCTSDSCENGQCVFAPLDCDDGDVCTFDFCDPQIGACQHLPGPDCACTAGDLWARDFVPGETADLSIDGNSFQVGWRVDGLRAFSPDQSLRYGDANGTGYAGTFGGRNFGRATGPSIAIPSTATKVILSFATFVDIDDDNADNDLFRARAVIAGGDNLQVWDRSEIGGTTNGVWVPVSIELPAAVIGQTIQIRWTFDSVNGDNNAGQGVFVDDIRLTVQCN
ncbi:MAG: hypothetical protein U1F43_20035 [Myxococcota bacterium]